MRAVICGAGIAGLALAQRLDTLGRDVVVVERASAPALRVTRDRLLRPRLRRRGAMGVLPRVPQPAYLVEEAASVDHNGAHRSAGPTDGARRPTERAYRLVHRRRLK
ncbi:NAD(P)-binding protein [Streptomyces sp. NPDC048197]|uniref:NAD(P)-binding protein n=1 Tax=Streptomyces sp. NPDC048197 TaxID=3365511 RepID=UPI0037156CEC